MTTNEQYIPSYEELNVPELKLTSVELRTGALYFGKYCDDICKEFMLCRQESGDIVKCVNEGKEVTRCAFEFFGKVKRHCLPEFTQYSRCIESYYPNVEAFRKCRGLQLEFDECSKEKIGIDRPYIGYFTKPRVYTGDRPDPGPEEMPVSHYAAKPPTREELNERTLQAKIRPRPRLIPDVFHNYSKAEESADK